MAEATAKLEKFPLGYKVIWEAQQVIIEVTKLNERGWSGDLTAELNITTSAPGVYPLLFFGRLNLLSVSAKSQLIKELKGKFDLAPWPTLLEATFFRVIEEYRRGTPLEEVGNAPIREGQAYRLKPFLPEGVITNIFGMGGSGKSYLALVIALSVLSGKVMAGLHPEQGHVLYLDYESDRPTVNERVRALKVGLDLPADLQLSYRRCDMPFTREVDRIIELVSLYNTKLVIIDSVGMSVQGTANADDVMTEYLRAVRSLGCTALLLDHMAKNSDGIGTPFGSGYKSFEARSAWQLNGEFHSESCSLSVGATHVKANDGAKFPAQGFLFSFTNNADNRPAKVAISRQDASIHFFDKLSKNERILTVLKESGQMSSKEIASELGLKPGDVSTLLSRLKRANEVMFTRDSKWAATSRRTDDSDIPF